MGFLKMARLAQAAPIHIGPQKPLVLLALSITLQPQTARLLALSASRQKFQFIKTQLARHKKFIFLCRQGPLGPMPPCKAPVPATGIRDRDPFFALVRCAHVPPHKPAGMDRPPPATVRKALGIGPW
jgi:hypothetical protein